ncbi:MAG: chemotaxis protein CheW [Pseudomonadota bacterium]
MKEEKITIHEDDFYKDDSVKEECVELALFRLANEWFGVDILDVKQIITIDKITFLPSAPKNIAGIISLKGNILSVTDIRQALSLESEQLTEDSRLVVIELGEKETALLVDEVLRVEAIPKSLTEPVLLTIAPERAEYFTGVCNFENKLIGMLSIKKIFDQV